MTSARWYGKGLRFQCQPDCGACCDVPSGTVFLSRTDVERLAGHHRMEPDLWLGRDALHRRDGRWMLRSVPESQVCIYFGDDRRCTVYEARPDQCRAYPFWPEVIRTSSTWTKESKECPGIEHPDAPMVRRRDVLRMARLDRRSTRSFDRF